MKTKKSGKLIALVCLMLTVVSMCALVFTGCDNGGGKAKEKKIGYSSSVTYTPYTDLGGYGSDFTIFVYNELTLYDDGTYVLAFNQLNYAGAWSVIITETDAKAFGTYTVKSEDEFGIIVDLSAATRVISKNTVQSNTVWNDTDDIATFTATEEQTADQQKQALLDSYAAKSGVEIDYATYALKLPAA